MATPLEVPEKEAARAPETLANSTQPLSWRVAKQFRPDSDACPGDLPRLPAWGEDEEADGGPHDRPSGAEAAAVADLLMPGEAAGREVPVKLRHLKVAAERGHLEAMYLLAQESDDRVERIQWLTMAAERGHVPAMHDLGLASTALHERRRWLLRAPSTAGPSLWPNWATWSAPDKFTANGATTGVKVLVGALASAGMPRAPIGYPVQADQSQLCSRSGITTKCYSPEQVLHCAVPDRE